MKHILPLEQVWQNNIVVEKVIKSVVHARISAYLGKTTIF